MKVSILTLALTAGFLYAAMARAQQTETKGGNMQQTIQAYKALEYPDLSGMPGFSAQLIANHMKLYQSYVTNVNALAEKLEALRGEGKERTLEYAELKRRFGWEFNGMRLHELYFANLGGAGTPRQSGRLYKAIQDDFGSLEAWQKDFTATGLMRGIGWAVLYRDNVSGRLFNTWINEHDGGHLAGCTPLIVMDVFEHAYLNDYQLEKAKYIDAFLKAVNWDEADKRWSK